MSDANRYKEVQADKWDEMTVSDLYEQLSILQSRALTAASMHNVPMLQQIQRGIDRIEALIADKSGNDDTITF